MRTTLVSATGSAGGVVASSVPIFQDTIFQYSFSRAHSRATGVLRLPSMKNVVAKWVPKTGMALLEAASVNWLSQSNDAATALETLYMTNRAWCG